MSAGVNAGLEALGDIGRILARAGVTRAQVDECLGIQSGSARLEGVRHLRGRPLAEILAARGYLTRTQALGLEESEEESANVPWSDRETTLPGPLLPERSTPAPHSGTAETPARIGRYEVRRALGRGSMGVVYLAWDPLLRREVALKVVSLADPARPELTARARREARAVARLAHPGIVPVHDVGEIDGRPFFTMEYVPGGNLAALLRERKTMPPAEALALLAAVADAVEHAHVHGVIHRDLKPENILLAPGEGGAESWRPKVADFGLAEVTGESESSITGDQAILGTLLHMSPEQARGELGAVDERSDVYALGSILYLALAGSPPHPAETHLQLWARKMEHDPVPLRKLAPRLSADVETVVHTALERDPARRYARARDLADDLRRCRNGEAIQARPPSAARRLRAAMRRHRGPATALAALAVGVGLAVCYPILEAGLASLLDARARRAAEGEARALLAAAVASRARGDAAGAERSAAAVVERFAAADRRGWEVRFADAHRLLAAIADGRGDRASARLHRYEAFDSLSARPERAGEMCDVGEERLAARDAAEATAWLSWVARQTEGEADRARAVFGLARAAQRAADLGAAAALYETAACSPAMPRDQAERARQLAAFARSYGRRATVPLRAEAIAGGDLDGDGRAELVACHGPDLAVGRVFDGAWQEFARVTLDCGEAGVVSDLAVVNIPGRAGADLAVSAVDVERQVGVFHRLRWQDGRWTVQARFPLGSRVGGVACADVDGDSWPEWIVGTLHDDRRLRVYADAGLGGEPALRCEVAVGSDVERLLAFDLDGDGAAEVAALTGAWSAETGWRILVYRWDAATGTLARIATVPAAAVRSLADLGGAAGEHRFALGTTWQDGWHPPLAAALGAERVGREFAGIGGLLWTPSHHDPSRLRLLAGHRGADASTGGYAVARCRRGGTDTLWCIPHEPAVERLGMGSAESTIRVFHAAELAADSEPRPLAEMTVPPDWPFARTPRAPQSLDVDGDGEEEIVVTTGQALVYLTSVDPGAAEPAERSPRTAREPGRTVRELDRAAAAERFGQPERALEAYRRIDLRSAAGPDLEEAVTGTVRCLSDLGRHEEAAQAALGAAGLRPADTGRLLVSAARVFESRRRWAEALRVTRRLREAYDLDADRRRKAEEDMLRFERRTVLPWRIAIAGEAASRGDLLATSALPFLARAGGGWTVIGPADGSERLWRVLGNGADAWRLAGEVETAGPPWGTQISFFLGLRPGNPDGAAVGSFCLLFSGGGSETRSLYSCEVRTAHPARPTGAALVRAYDPWAEPVGFRLELTPEQQVLEASLHRGAAPAHATVQLPSAALSHPRLAAGIEVKTTPGAPEPGVFVVPALELAAADEAMSLLDETAADLETRLGLAHGRWVQDRRAEAAQAYGEVGEAAAREGRTALAACAYWHRAMLRLEERDAAAATADRTRAGALDAAEVLRLETRFAAALRRRGLR